MVFTSGEINTNKIGGTSVELSITNETIITLDVFSKSGTHNNSKFSLSFSPDDGISWVDGEQNTIVSSSVTFIRSTTKVRVCIVSVERTEATAMVFITAK